MINILKRWPGKFEIDGEIVDPSELNFKDGDEFDITLLPEREVDDEE